MIIAGRELRSRIDADGTLTLSIEQVAVPNPGPDEVVVRVEASPINPSDLGLLTGPADLLTCRNREGGAGRVSFSVPRDRLAGVAGRLGQSMPVGNEGSGTVVVAGRDCAHLEGRLVSTFGGGMYADYKLAKARNVLVLPPSASAAEGASAFINPLTALGFVETARAGGHRAMVVTAAASNLGRMLNRLCLAEGIELVGIVRSQEQVRTLRAAGATDVLDSEADGFLDALTSTLRRTGARIAFDAVGGGRLGGDVLLAMERSAPREEGYDIYGSKAFKQLYIYGALDLSPTVIGRVGLGFRWNVSGWLLWPFLEGLDRQAVDRLQRRVADELTTTFASSYGRTIGLADLLEPDVLRSCRRMTTGDKVLVNPAMG